MSRLLLLAFLATSNAARADDGLIASTDEMRFQTPKEAASASQSWRSPWWWAPGSRSVRSGDRPLA
jgi:hypothetical protein